MDTRLTDAKALLNLLERLRADGVDLRHVDLEADGDLEIHAAAIERRVVDDEGGYVSFHALVFRTEKMK